MRDGVPGPSWAAAAARSWRPMRPTTARPRRPRPRAGSDATAHTETRQIGPAKQARHRGPCRAWRQRAHVHVPTADKVTVTKGSCARTSRARLACIPTKASCTAARKIIFEASQKYGWKGNREEYASRIDYNMDASGEFFTEETVHTNSGLKATSRSSSAVCAVLTSTAARSTFTVIWRSTISVTTTASNSVSNHAERAALAVKGASWQASHVPGASLTPTTARAAGRFLRWRRKNWKPPKRRLKRIWVR